MTGRLFTCFKTILFKVSLFNIPQKILSLFSCVSNLTLLGFLVGTMTQNFSAQNLIRNTCNCNMASGCTTSYKTYKCVKFHTRGNSKKSCAKALIHYGWQVPWECTVQAWLHFYQYTPRQKWGVRVLSIESVELQGRGSTYDHNLQRGGDRLVVSIKYR